MAEISQVFDKDGDAAEGFFVAVGQIVSSMVAQKPGFCIDIQDHRNWVCDSIKEVGSALLQVKPL